MTRQILTTDGLTLSVTIHIPLPDRNRQCAVLYFHGGGLLYGQRDDLPEVYVKMFLEAGYTLYCFDYPLAPETCLSGIHKAVQDCARWFCDSEYQSGGFTGWFLFGRSAGAYLALTLAGKLRYAEKIPPLTGILDFYGYYDLTAPFLHETSAHYNALPQIPAQLIRNLQSGAPVTEGNMDQRFSLYIYARQTGRWMDMLCATQADLKEYSLSVEDIQRLPPLFITASSGDMDVPMGVSKNLSRLAPDVRYKWVYYLEHDFDRDITNPTGQNVYKQCLAWMDELCQKC